MFIITDHSCLLHRLRTSTRWSYIPTERFYGGWYSRCSRAKESQRVLLGLFSDVFDPFFLLVRSTLGTALMLPVVILYTHFANIDSGFAIRAEHITIVYCQFRDCLGFLHEIPVNNLIFVTITLLLGIWRLMGLHSWCGKAFLVPSCWMGECLWHFGTSRVRCGNRSCDLPKKF